MRENAIFILTNYDRLYSQTKTDLEDSPDQLSVDDTMVNAEVEKVVHKFCDQIKTNSPTARIFTMKENLSQRSSAKSSQSLAQVQAFIQKELAPHVRKLHFDKVSVSIPLKYC